MSIDINWERLTGGDDGARLAESIRAFIHDRFQKVTLPRFIRSVKVHSFDFGSVAPDVEIKDVCDPLPDFYDDDDEEDDGDDGVPADGDNADSGTPLHDHPSKPDAQQQQHQQAHAPPPSQQPQPGPPKPPLPQRPTLNAVQPPPQLRHRHSVESTSQPMSPAIPGGTTNFSYFHMPLNPAGHALQRATGGTATPHFHPSWPLMNSSTSSFVGQAGYMRGSVSHDAPISPLPEEPTHDEASTASDEPAPTDVQIVSHLRYSGDVRLSLTADILLDYPTTSFVGIPLQLNVTGMSFDGVAILAYIRRRAHFCFLAPDDADALVGGDESGLEDSDGEGGVGNGSPAPSPARGRPTPQPRDSGAARPDKPPRKPVGGLFEEIHVESEIGQRENGKQVLKNVGKVEKFVLEQVRKIFENEFVYPSFWTFLV